ncbi:MAG TPA: GntR family transcriptional regulator [Candidatus Limnocylindrales bacterium]|nr:GntR family transcriptional regulator [Candidatus Limnocylindrales bacterium]
MTTTIRPIDPGQRSTLGTIVTDQLRDHVIHGRFPPGTVLGEVDLAARFGVSRGPIREALQRLVQEGLLRREPKRGISVPKLDPADLRDVYLAREAIETAAVGRAIERGGTSLATALRSLVTRMEAAAEKGDWAAVADLDMAFHRRIVEASGSPRLGRLYASVLGEALAFLNMNDRHRGRPGVTADHSDLAELIAAGDAAASIAAIRRHYTTSVDRLTRPDGTTEAGRPDGDAAEAAASAHRTTRGRHVTARTAT